jgi:hypothetical protein
MNLWKSLKKETQEMLKSWGKVFLAAVATLIASGEDNLRALLAAGLASLIPLVITWLDPNDYRFGKMKEIAKPVKTTKAVKKTAK